MSNASATARQADHPIAAQFLGRHSSRSFTDQTVSDAQMLTLFEAARWAPSASNVQPWRFVFALRGDAAFDAIADTLMPFNKTWASKAAAMVVVASQTTTVSAEGETNPNPWHSFDAGAAWAQLGLQAHLDGLVAHAMGGFDAGALAPVVHLPVDHALHAVVAIGYQGDKARLPEVLQARETPNGRKPLADVVARGTFGA